MSAPSPAGAANGCIARRRSSPGSGVRDSRKRTETGGEERRRGQSPGLAARAKRERRARERAGAAGTNSRRARETRLQQNCHVDCNSTRLDSLALAQQPLSIEQAHYSDTPPVLCRRVPFFARWAVAQSFCWVTSALFFSSSPGNFVELRSCFPK